MEKVILENECLTRHYAEPRTRAWEPHTHAMATATPSPPGGRVVRTLIIEKDSSSDDGDDDEHDGYASGQGGGDGTAAAANANAGAPPQVRRLPASPRTPEVRAEMMVNEATRAAWSLVWANVDSYSDDEEEAEERGTERDKEGGRGGRGGQSGQSGRQTGTGGAEVRGHDRIPRDGGDSGGGEVVVRSVHDVYCTLARETESAEEFAHCCDFIEDARSVGWLLPAPDTARKGTPRREARRETRREGGGAGAGSRRPKS